MRTTRTALGAGTATALAALALLATAAPAQDATGVDYTEMSLQQLMDIPVVAASKHEQPAREAPSSVTVLTRRDIEAWGWRTLGDLLRSVPGFYVSYDRTYGFVGARGFNRTRDYGGRILLLVDGHRLNDPVYGTFANRLDFLLDLDLVERVEVVRGPGSSLYGDNAFFGVVNVVTRRGRDLGGAEVAASAGSLDSYTGRLTWGDQSAAGVEGLLSGSLFDSHGEDDLYFPELADPATGDGHARDLDDEEAASVFGRVAYRGFSASVGYADRDKQVPTARYDTVFGDPRFTARDSRLVVAAELARTLPSGWDVLARASYDQYSYRGRYPYAVDDGATVVDYEDVDADWAGVEAQARRLVAGRHLLTFGAEYRDLLEEEQEYYNRDPFALLYTSDLSFESWGAFVQDEVRLADAVLVNLGVRLDSYETFGETVNPRLGVILDPWPGTTLKLVCGTAFRAPNVGELFYQEGDDVRDVNPYLDAETITTYEAVWEQRLGTTVRTTLALYRNEVSDIIEFSPDADGSDTYYHVNLGDATATGGEVEVELGLPNGVRGRASYAYAEVEAAGWTGPFDNSPEHLGKLNLLVPLGSERVTGGLEAQHTSSRLVDGGGEVPAFWLVNANLLARLLGDDLHLSLGVYNLLDEEYWDPAYGVPTRIEQDGLTVRAKATYRF